MIGGGAAGLSAALELARARRSVLLVDAGGLEGREELSAGGGAVVDAAVTGIVSTGSSGFEVQLEDGRSVAARRVLVTSGLRDELAIDAGPVARPGSVPPPGKHLLTFMIWLCVFPTLLAINYGLGGWLKTLSPAVRTLVIATTAVLIVLYGLMPYLHRLRARLMIARTGPGRAPSPAASPETDAP